MVLAREARESARRTEQTIAFLNDGMAFIRRHARTDARNPHNHYRTASSEPSSIQSVKKDMAAIEKDMAAMREEVANMNDRCKQWFG